MLKVISNFKYSSKVHNKRIADITHTHTHTLSAAHLRITPHSFFKSEMIY